MSSSDTSIVFLPMRIITRPRFWYAERAVMKTSFHPAAADEARWVTYLLEDNLGETPETSRTRFGTT